MAKRPSLVKQVTDTFCSMYIPSRSKHADKKHNHGKAYRDIIYSAATLKTYIRRASAAMRWMQETYGIRYIRDGRKHVSEYLRMRILSGISPHTIYVDACALAKLYQCSYLDFGVLLPPRSRDQVTRYNNITHKTLRNFQEAEPDIFTLAIGTGQRNHELRLTAPKHYQFSANESGNLMGSVWIKGKGGRRRRTEILAEHVAAIQEIVNRALAEKRSKVLLWVPDGLPIHFCRHMYAASLYIKYARPVASIPRADRYYCRLDMKGIVLDRTAMQKVSNSLGHNRLGVVTTYLRTAITHHSSIVTIPDALIRL